MPNYMKAIEKRLKAGDALMARGLHGDAARVYEHLVEMFQAMEEAQEPVSPGGPTRVPLSLRLIVINRDLIVPLDRLATAHLGTGDRAAALRCLEEVVQRLERVAGLAGGETRANLEKDLAGARDKLSRVRSEPNEAGAEERYWIAYRGRDTGQKIRVFPEANPESAERMRMLLESAARHQSGQVSAVFEADSQTEALRMAPFQFT
jgi:hypothetical protein